MVLRILFGFCFSGVYVTAESWLNNAVSNENRGKALSLYVLVQMAGIVAAQFILLTGDASGFVLFIVPSVLVSVAFLPILLSINPTPAFGSIKRMSFKRLYKTSPLGCVGIVLLGGVFSAQFGMAAVYGSAAGMTTAQIPLFVAVFYVGALVLQYPIGWLSDRMDRRQLIMWVSVIGGIGATIGVLTSGVLAGAMVAAFFVGGLSNPLYALLLAYTNDFLDGDDMAAASGGLLFINGLGAIAGPILTGWLMDAVGPSGYWMFIGVLMFATGVYALYRMSRRAARARPDEVASYAPIMPTSTPVAVEAAQEYYSDQVEEAAAAGGPESNTREQPAASG